MAFARRGQLPRAGMQLVGGLAVPRDVAGENRRAMEAAAAKAAAEADKAIAAAQQAIDARLAAQAAMQAAQALLAGFNQAAAAKDVELAAQRALGRADLEEAIRAAHEHAMGAGSTRAAVEALALQIEATAGRSGEHALLAQRQVELAALEVGKLVGIKYINLIEEGDEIILVIVLTDGRILRKNVRGLRGYGSAGPAGADGRKGDPGARTLTYREVSADTTVASDDDIIGVDATAGDVTVTLPAIDAELPSRTLFIKRLNETGGNVIVAAASGETIEFVASRAINVWKYTVRANSTPAGWIET